MSYSVVFIEAPDAAATPVERAIVVTGDGLPVRELVHLLDHARAFLDDDDPRIYYASDVREAAAAHVDGKVIMVLGDRAATTAELVTFFRGQV